MDYERLTLKNAVGLAAPHTWAASIFPVLLGTALSVALANRFSLIIFLLVAVAAVLLQSSVNTINDYYDFMRGTDLVENSDDPDDAVLVYNNLNPKHVLLLGGLYMAAAVILGIYPVYRGGMITFLLGLFGCLVIALYSSGKHPISHFPLGELISGGVMGGMLTTAVFSAFTGYADGEILFLSLPLIVGIGLIMMTNNTCDIERDVPTGRKTLPSLLGREHARFFYRLLVGLWVTFIIILTFIWFGKCVVATSLVLLGALPAVSGLFRAPLVPNLRGLCMGSILNANIWLNTAYIAGIAVYILFY